MRGVKLPFFGHGPAGSALAAPLVALLLLAGPAAQAGQILDAAGLEALAGRATLHFRTRDGAYGAEQFLPGRRSLWKFAGGSACQSGHWYPRGQAICFLYEGEVAPSCWVLELVGEGLVARSETDESAPVLTLERIDPAPLPCPHVGVGS